MSRRRGNFSRLMRRFPTRLKMAGCCAVLLLVALLSLSLHAEEFPEYKARATFIYHLADHVKWKVRPVAICTYGYDAATQHLEKLSQIPGAENKVLINKNVGLEDIS